MYRSLSYMACKDSTYMLRDCGNASSRSSPPSVRACAAYPWSRRAGGTNRACHCDWNQEMSVYISRWHERAFEVQSQKFPLTIRSDYMRWYWGITRRWLFCVCWTEQISTCYCTWATVGNISTQFSYFLNLIYVDIIILKFMYRLMDLCVRWWW